MKFILFNLNDTKKHITNKIQIENNNYLTEISISKYKLNQLEEKNTKGFKRIKCKLLDLELERVIFKALSAHDKKWYYVLSKDLINSKYLKNKTQSMLGYKQNIENELDANIFKYIDEYVSSNKSIKKHEIKVMLVSNTNEDINFTLITNLIKNYKTVNLYIKEIPSAYTMKRIKQINKKEGTTIDILKKERKSFVEYNVVYFVDDVKENYPRFRYNKEALIIDQSLKYRDKFNSNIEFIEEYILNNNVNKDSIMCLTAQYEKIEIANVISKIINTWQKLVFAINYSRHN